MALKTNPLIDVMKQYCSPYRPENLIKKIRGYNYHHQYIIISNIINFQEFEQNYNIRDDDEYLFTQRRTFLVAKHKGIF